jgi:hypothetical protein
MAGGDWTETSVLPTVSGRLSGGDSGSSQSGVEMISAGRSGASPMQALPQFALAVGQTPLAAAALPNPQMTPTRPASGNTSLLRQQYGQLPLSFEVNQGQIDSQVQFLAHGSGYSLFLTATEAVMALGPPQAAASVGQVANLSGQQEASWQPAQPTATPPVVVTMQVVGGNPAPQVVGRDELPGKVNYFLGNDPHKWHTDVATYGKVEYQDVYPGINLDYYGRQGQLEYDFVVAPGADPRAIHVGFSGADDLSLNDQGDLIIHTGGQDIVQHKPFVYQDVNGSRQDVTSSFVLLRNPSLEPATVQHGPQAAQQIGFALGSYDVTRPIVIDPVLAYSTYVGGSGSDYGNGIAVDVGGNAYITGLTTSTDFPTANAFQAAKGGSLTNWNAFVMKLSADGLALVYSTYLGGSNFDYADGIAVDAAGDAYVTGTTRSTDFPTANAFQPAMKGNLSNAFLTQLSGDGASLVYSTYLGGSGYGENGNAIAVDDAGNAYVTGVTGSTDFPTANAFQSVKGGSAQVDNAFVTKFSVDGTSLVYSTYLGGSGDGSYPFGDFGFGIALDAASDAYVTGWTDSRDFPTANAFQPTNHGYRNAFVTKFSADGAGLVYSTFLGGNEYDRGYGIAVDLAGSAYITGATVSTDFPTANAYQPVKGGDSNNDNAFVTKLSADGGSLVYSSYLGGSGSGFPDYYGDTGGSIAVDTAGNAHVTGTTYSTDFPTANAFQSTKNGPYNAFVAMLSIDGASLTYSSYLGGSGYYANGDFGSGIAVDPASDVYITGATSSTDFPTANAFQSNLKGYFNVFAAKIEE